MILFGPSQARRRREQPRGGWDVADEEVQQPPLAACPPGASLEGLRRALPHSRVMIHQPLGGYQGQASDIEIHAKEILKTKQRLNEILAKHTGQDIERVRHDTERDKFLSALEAKEYGIVDDVITPRKAGVAPAA